jgi:hypothetical protein
MKKFHFLISPEQRDTTSNDEWTSALKSTPEAGSLFGRPSRVFPPEKRSAEFNYNRSAAIVVGSPFRLDLRFSRLKQ